MQIAQDRVRVLTAVDGVRTHASACVESLYLHNAVVRKALVALSSASAATLSFLMFRKKEKKQMNYLLQKNKREIYEE